MTSSRLTRARSSAKLIQLGIEVSFLGARPRGAGEWLVSDLSDEAELHEGTRESSVLAATRAAVVAGVWLDDFGRLAHGALRRHVAAREHVFDFADGKSVEGRRLVVAPVDGVEGRRSCFSVLAHAAPPVWRSRAARPVVRPYWRARSYRVDF